MKNYIIILIQTLKLKEEALIDYSKNQINGDIQKIQFSNFSFKTKQTHKTWLALQNPYR